MSATLEVTTIQNTLEVTVDGTSHTLEVQIPASVELLEVGNSGAVSSVNGQNGAVVLNTSHISESGNLYHTAARVLATVLTGLSTASNTVVTASHTVLQAFGFLQKQITDLTSTVSGKADTSAVNSALSGKQDALVSGTNIKSINGQSILGAGDLAVSGGTTILRAYKSAHQIVNNSTTLQADEHLFVEVESGGIYEISAKLFVGAADNNSSFKFDFAAGTATAVNYIAHTSAEQADSSSAIPRTQAWAINANHFGGTLANGSDYILKVGGSVEIDEGGTFAMRWAQTTATVNDTYLYQGSILILTKMN